MTNQMDLKVNIPSKIIPSKRIQPLIDLWYRVKDRQVQSSTIILKASVKDHIISGSQTLKEKLGAISHICMAKTSISSRIQKIRKVPLVIFPLYGQIQGEVVVGTTNCDNLGGSTYLCLFKLIGLTCT